MDFNNKSRDLQLLKFNLFKSQNFENGRFNVIFEIEGKVLYAHQNMLDLVSDTFDVMLSDRWNKKDEPIKIEAYSYDNFYQFLTFLYSGQCQLTDSNIFSMVDMAEFYGVESFKIYCDEYLADMTITTKNIFPLMELAEKYSMARLRISAYKFIAKNFQSFVDSDSFMKLNKTKIDELLVEIKDKVKPENLFQGVYKFSEKQAIDKKAADPSINLNDAIKSEISDYLRYIDFRQMKFHFLLKFVVSKGFIFSSLDELSDLLCDRHFEKTGIKVTNVNGQTLHGNLINNENALDCIKFLKSSTSIGSSNTFCWWDTKGEIPSTPSPIKKRNGVRWYLVFDYAGDIWVKHYSELNDANYILAELSVGDSGFEMTSDCKIEII